MNGLKLNQTIEMKNPKINFAVSEKETEFIISIPPSPIIIRLFLILFALLSFIIPILVFVYCIINQKELGFGFILAAIIGFGTGIYLFRIVLWNTFGAEHILISSKGIKYFCNYRFFKDNSHFINIKDVVIESKESIFVFKTETESFSTSIQIPEEMIENLCKNMKNLIEKYSVSAKSN